MEWNAKTPVILYGAAYAGTLAWNYLNKFCNLIAFIDKRADELNHHMGLPVVTIDSDHISDETKKKSVVIVCVKNIFDHERITLNLVKYGYGNIVFCPVDGSAFTYRSSVEREQLAAIYDCIISNNLTLPVYIPHSRGIFHLDFHDSTIEIQSDDTLIVRIPTFFAYFQSIIGQNEPILALFTHLELFDWFAGDIKACPDFYIDQYCVDAAKNTGVTTTERWVQNILDSRKEVYEKMRIAEEIEPLFFYDHAVPAIWDKNGYFNMKSGKHRAAYLIHRRKMLIPLQLTAEDYNIYLNISAVNDLISFITERDIFELPYPILHPYFLKMPFMPQNNYFELFLDFTRWLSICIFKEHGKLNFKGISLFDTTGILYPLLQCLCKLGCKAECLYPVGEFDVLINSLYHIMDPPVQTDILSGKYDVVFVEYCETNTNLPCDADYYGVLLSNKNKIVMFAEKFHIDLIPLRSYKGFTFAVGKKAVIG